MSRNFGLATRHPDQFFPAQKEKMMESAEILKIAQACHQANKGLCEAFGDTSQKDWNDAPQWQRDSAVQGVHFCIDNPNAPASANHDSWMKEKVDGGWVYGAVKDPEAKTHPCIVPFDQLPPEQTVKDHVFKTIVATLKPRP